MEWGERAGFWLMKTASENWVGNAWQARLPGTQAANFRRRFQGALRETVRHGFAVEECFGTIWEEVRDEVPLSDAQEFELFQEMIAWAKERILRGSFRTYSPEFSSVAGAFFGEALRCRHGNSRRSERSDSLSQRKD